MRKIVVVLILVVMCILSFFIGRRTSHNINYQGYVGVDSIIHIDTVAYLLPIPRDSVVIRYDHIAVPIVPAHCDSIEHCFDKENVTVDVSQDSATIHIPITQQVYETDTYRAYVSGYRPILDSIFIMNKKTEVIVKKQTKTNRFDIGVQAGYGLTPKGFQPYVGIGVSIKIF